MRKWIVLALTAATLGLNGCAYVHVVTTLSCGRVCLPEAHRHGEGKGDQSAPYGVNHQGDEQ